MKTENKIKNGSGSSSSTPAVVETTLNFLSGCKHAWLWITTYQTEEQMDEYLLSGADASVPIYYQRRYTDALRCYNLFMRLGCIKLGSAFGQQALIAHSEIRRCKA